MPELKQQVMEDTAVGSSASTGPFPPLRKGGDEPRHAPPAPKLEPDPHHRVATLLNAIEGEVIPRLVRARGLPRDPETANEEAASDAAASGHATAAGNATSPTRAITPACVARMRHVLLGNQPADRLLTEMLADGVTIDQIYSDLMAPCARELGAMWERDEANFAEVTLGLGRLQQMMRDLSYDFGGEVTPEHGEDRVLLAAPPGEQHTFGVLMVAEYFRREGWDVVAMPLASAAELEDAIRHDWYAVAGFSAGSADALDPLASIIRAIRKVSLNRSLRVMVGGAAFAERPELVAHVGADAWAEDARRAPMQAKTLLGQTTTPRCPT
jgi:methanogenic corrinoid protein MtbC1